MIIDYEEFYGNRLPVLEAYHVIGTDDIAVPCTACGLLHRHGRGDGHRLAHCRAAGYEHGYILREVGSLTLGSLRECFPLPPIEGAPRKRKGISLRTRARIFDRDGFRCRRCGNGPDDEKLVVDHIVPVSRGGSDEDANLQTLCEPCNQGKAGQAPHVHDLRPFRQPKGHP